MSVRRRGNGLTADSYVLLLDVDSRVSDALLAAMATAGVAAYTTPAPGRDTTPPPSPPPPSPPQPSPSARLREAVHVDSTRRPQARRVLEDTMPDLTVGMPSIAEEDSFAALVAGFDTEPTSRDWPSAEDVSPSPPPPPPGEASEPPQRRRTDLPPTVPPTDRAPRPTPARSAEPSDAQNLPSGTTGPDAPDPTTNAKPARESTRPSLSGATVSGSADSQDVTNLEPDEGFVPPPIEPMPPTHPVTKWGLVALGLGVVLLLFPTLLGLRHSTAVDVVGVLSIVGGVGLLVSRLSDDSSGDYDGPDDGAVV